MTDRPYRQVFVSPYDLLLALVPLSLLAGVGGAWLLSLSTTVGVVCGGLSAATVVSYGLFYRTPVDREPGRERDRRPTDDRGTGT